MGPRPEPSLVPAPDAARAASLAILAAAALAACASPPLSATAETATVAEIRRDLESIPAALAARGPNGWLGHCDPADFRMISDGAVKFASFGELRTAMAGFAMTVRAMELNWRDLRIEPMTDRLAWFSTAYDERITDTVGGESTFDGSVTGMLRRVGNRWLITRLHWSQRP
ncbi:MAG: nuclear transport factor 2 family protein [Planctomycetes bacterium]|nr:nuclear transport factor 2 family protein [Planctomycetota bacterium]